MNIVPVIAKADTLTLRERERLKKRVSVLYKYWNISDILLIKVWYCQEETQIILSYYLFWVSCPHIEMLSHLAGGRVLRSDCDFYLRSTLSRFKASTLMGKVANYPFCFRFWMKLKNIVSKFITCLMLNQMRMRTSKNKLGIWRYSLSLGSTHWSILLHGLDALCRSLF